MDEEARKVYFEYLKENSQKTETITTCCKDCVFAVYDDEDKQVSCNAGRLEKFFDHAKQYTDGDSGRSYYIIEKVCNMCRPEEWAANKFDAVQSAKAEIEIKCDFLLLSFDDDPQNTVENICSIANICVNQKNIKPKTIFVIVKNFNINYQNLHDALLGITKDSPIEYKLIRITETVADPVAALDRTVKKCKGQYYVCIDTTKCQDFPSDFLYTMNTAINENLQPVVIMEEEGFSFVLNKLHRYLNGNKMLPLKEKVDMLSEIQNNKVSIVKWKELQAICPE